MEVIDIGLNDLEPISLNFNDGPPSKSVNFGPGIELLMNDKKKLSSSESVDLGDLNNLENELNELSGAATPTKPSGESKTLSGFASSLFGFGGSTSGGASESTDSKLGSATSESAGNTKTWDGFSKLNEVPLHDDSRTSAN